MFLLLTICSLIFLQSKVWKRRNSLEREHKITCFMFCNNVFHKTWWERAMHPPCFKREAMSAKSGVLKLLFPDIGKIANP